MIGTQPTKQRSLFTGSGVTVLEHPFGTKDGPNADSYRSVLYRRPFWMERTIHQAFECLEWPPAPCFQREEDLRRMFRRLATNKFHCNIEIGTKQPLNTRCASVAGSQNSSLLSVRSVSSGGNVERMRRQGCVAKKVDAMYV
jgi:hypothetical protein